jgi:hypothetical protein
MSTQAKKAIDKGKSSDKIKEPTNEHKVADKGDDASITSEKSKGDEGSVNSKKSKKKGEDGSITSQKSQKKGEDGSITSQKSQKKGEDGSITSQKSLKRGDDGSITSQKSKVDDGGSIASQVTGDPNAAPGEPEAESTPSPSLTLPGRIKAFFGRLCCCKCCNMAKRVSPEQNKPPTKPKEKKEVPDYVHIRNFTEKWEEVSYATDLSPRLTMNYLSILRLFNDAVIPIFLYQSALNELYLIFID